MPMIGLFRQPIFSISKILLKPLVGAIVYNNTIYNALWSFAGFAISNVGFFKGLIILYSIRKFIFGYINLPSLSNIIYNFNPILSVIYDNVLKPELNKIKYQNFTFQISIRKLINYIILNSFLLIFNSIFKVLFKFISIVIFTTLTVFWLGSIKNVEYILLAATEIKEIIKYYLFIDLPVPSRLYNRRKWMDYLIYIYYYIKDNINFTSYFSNIFTNKSEHITYVRKISKFEGVQLHFNLTDSAEIELINKSIDLANQINLQDILYKNEFYLKLLNYLFNEFNLFC